MSRKILIQKSGWNIRAAFFGPFWYIYRGMAAKGLVLLVISLCTLGVGIVPVWIYCGYNANKDFYTHIKNKGTYIY